MKDMDHSKPGTVIGGIICVVAMLMLAFTLVGGIVGEFSFRTISMIVAELLLMVVGLLVGSSIKVAGQYETAVVLRFGSLRSTHVGGLFMVVPVIDTVVDYVDNRIQGSRFNAEQVLTKDTVPVNVDAILFWVAVDAKRATLEVRDYRAMVIAAAQTALRDIVGRSNLTQVLSEPEYIAKELEKKIDDLSKEWGIDIKSVELRDVQIPQGLQEAMSREAQAEREKNARIILSDAEIKIADNYLAASKIYDKDPTAIQLRGMNILYEVLKEHGGSILIPTDITNTFGLAGSLALKHSQAALASASPPA